MWKKAITLVMAAAASRAADLPTGQIVDSVECALDHTQHYVLYLPTNYTPSRQWSVILAFDGGARGRVPVERYRQAADNAVLPFAVLRATMMHTRPRQRCRLEYSSF